MNRINRGRFIALFMNQGHKNIPEDFHTTFDIETKNNGQSIIEVATLVDLAFIEKLYKSPNDLRIIDRRKFEIVIAELFRGFGYEIELTQATRDGGKDIIAIKHSEVDVKYLIECKRPNPGNPVRLSTVRELLGVKTDQKATKAILATTTYFTPDAHQFQDRHEWELDLKEYDSIMDWIADYINRKK